MFRKIGEMFIYMKLGSNRLSVSFKILNLQQSFTIANCHTDLTADHDLTNVWRLREACVSNAAIVLYSAPQEHTNFTPHSSR
jgi:hypothetical protein